MNKKIDLAPSGSLQTKTWYKFDFVLEANVGSEDLVESYIGVDFSILYETHIILIQGAKQI